jgi:metal-responsive CopG/Arc/MetJ family transcriptional regulator
MPTGQGKSRLKMLHIMMDEDFLTALDDYQFAHRYRTRSEAVRAILRQVLEHDARVRRRGQPEAAGSE